MSSPTESNISAAPSDSSIEIRDLLFCMHGCEKCEVCSMDAREDNSLTLGIEPSDLDRQGLEIDYIINQKDHTFQCKKHKKCDCKQCYNFKKDITKYTKEAEKEHKQKLKMASASNF